MTRLRQLPLIQSRRLAAGLCLAWALLLVPPLRATPAAADVVINDCTTSTALAAALNGPSGLITFNCGLAPVTIVLTQDGGFNAVPASTFTIDGGNLVTLSGGNANRVFDVASTAALTLSNIILSNGYAAGSPGLPSQGGAVLINNGGVLVLDHATIRDSQSTYAGGAIENAYGTTTLVDSLIENNQSDYGGGIDSAGTLTLTNTTVRHNHALYDHGGGLDVGGTVVINSSTIYSNSASQYGGGINIAGAATVTISQGQIASNAATSPNGYGGGIFNDGTLTITNSSLSDNSANRWGGGIDNDAGSADLNHVTFSGNSATDGGGIGNGSLMIATQVTLSGNSATYGGGIENGYHLGLTNATLSGNSATYGGGIENYNGSAELINVTLSANWASVYGGGIDNNQGSADLINVTLSGNSAPYGGGISHFALFITQTLTLYNTIVANSPADTNCRNRPTSVTDITSNGFNLSSDDSCSPYFNQPGDQNNTPARLGPLANNGGFTLTHLPLPPITPGVGPIDNGGGIGCPATDQRGVSRPQGAACDIGAVEYRAGDVTPWLYLPLILR